MKKICALKALTLVVLSFVLLLSLISCGELAVEKFTPVRASVKTSYLEGEAVDFSGIKVFIQYNDSSLDAELTLADGLVLSYDDDITATAGNKQLKISYECPHTGTTQEAILPILVEVDPDAPRHDAYVVDTTEMKTTYTLGETVDFTGIKVIEKFTNGGADVAMTDLSLLSYTYDAATITATAGTKQIVVTYNGEAAGTIAITVNYPAITNITVNLNGIKTDYLKGETASFAGLTFTLTYANGETRTADTFTLVSNAEALLSSFGEKDVLVKFNDPISGKEQSASFKIKVDGIKDYTVDVTNVKTEYDAGEDLDFTGITVTANYYFGKTEAVTTGIAFVYDDNITNTAGNKQVTVTVGGVVVDTFTIAVGDIPTLVLNTQGIRLSYRVGDTVSLSGLTATVTYKDDATKNFTVTDLQYTLEGVTAEGGVKKISVTYMLEGEIAISADVTLTVYAISGYDVETDGVKLTYIVGDALALGGIKVYAKYDDGGERVLIDPSRVTLDTEVTTATVGSKAVRVFVDGNSAAVGTVNITVDKNTIEKIEILGDFKTAFEKGKDILFTGMTVKLTYKNGSSVILGLDKLSFTGADKNTLGKQTVTVSFLDEVNGEDANTSLMIEVFEKKTVVQFEESAEIKDFKTSNSDTVKKEYGQTGFESQYENKVTYLIGDDNEFVFYPLFSIMDGTAPTTLTNGFYTKVTLRAKVNGGYQALTAKIDDPTKPSIVSYYEGDVLFATVNTYYGRYQFTEAAKNREIEISVLPDDTRYNAQTTINPVTLEAKVIDGYNVTNAQQLSVIDNTQSVWNTLKAEWDLLGISPAAIILHKDIKIKASDIPEEFLYTLDKDIVYTNDTTKETKTIKAGTKYLQDAVTVYHRLGNADFAIEGNLFTVDMSELPLVPSPAVFGDGQRDYGNDFSNATLIRFEDHSTRLATDKMASILLENLSVRGNAGVDKWVDENGHLISAGGIIFMKAVYYTDVTVYNTNVNSCFIPFFSDFDGYLTLDAVKIYDSYQNALYIWGNDKCEIKNSYLVRAGGPMIVTQSLYHKNQEIRPATVSITDTVIESNLSGEELWFVAIDATGLVTGQVKPLLYGLEQSGIGQFIDKDGKMDIIGVMTTDTDAEGYDGFEAVVGNMELEGMIVINGEHGIIRDIDGDPTWSAIYNHPEYKGGGAFITVGWGADAVVLYNLGGEELYVAATGDVFNPYTSVEHSQIYQKFAAANYFTLTRAGMSVVFGRAE